MFFTQVSQDKEEGGQIARGVGYCLCYVRLPNYIEALIAERVELFRIGDLCDDVGLIRVSDVALGEFVGNAPTKDIRLLVGSDQLVFPLVAVSLGQDFFHALTTPSPVSLFALVHVQLELIFAFVSAGIFGRVIDGVVVERDHRQ